MSLRSFVRSLDALLPSPAPLPPPFLIEDLSAAEAPAALPRVSVAYALVRWLYATYVRRALCGGRGRGTGEAGSGTAQILRD